MKERKERKQRVLDIAIIGGGPAGLTAGLYAMRGGADAVLFEALFAGGQATRTHQIDNYPGFPNGIEGYQLGVELEQQAARFGLRTEYASVEAAALAGPVKRLTVDGRTVEARTVILAMGARPRPLGLPREEALTGSGVSYCATCDGAFFKGRPVAVVGGGDTAIADALYLARFAEKVYVVHRRDRLRAARTLQEAAFAEGKIAFVWNAVAEAFVGETSVEGLTVRDVRTGALTTLAVAGVFAAVGILPQSELARGQVACAEDGRIITNEFMETDVPGVFAAGDVRTTPLRQIVTACADGALAATRALEYCAANGNPGPTNQTERTGG